MGRSNVFNKLASLFPMVVLTYWFCRLIFLISNPGVLNENFLHITSFVGWCCFNKVDPFSLEHALLTIASNQMGARRRLITRTYLNRAWDWLMPPESDKIAQFQMGCSVKKRCLVLEGGCHHKQFHSSKLSKKSIGIKNYSRQVDMTCSLTNIFFTLLQTMA